MTTDVNKFSAMQIDINSKQTRSTQSLIETGGWFFKQIATYTESSPLAILEDNTAKLVIPENDVGLVDGSYFELLYDYPNQRFMPRTEGDVYLANVRLKVKPSAQAGHLDLVLNTPNVAYNPINAETLTFNKASDEEHYLSANFMLFIGSDIVTNGIELMAKPIRTNVEIYDYSFLISRLYSAKGNPR